jgi:hypothetical protein
MIALIIGLVMFAGMIPLFIMVLRPNTNSPDTPSPTHQPTSPPSPRHQPTSPPSPTHQPTSPPSPVSSKCDLTFDKSVSNLSFRYAHSDGVTAEKALFFEPGNINYVANAGPGGEIGNFPISSDNTWTLFKVDDTYTLKQYGATNIFKGIKMIKNGIYASDPSTIPDIDGYGIIAIYRTDCPFPLGTIKSSAH